jgi:hypothetical protein
VVSSGALRPGLKKRENHANAMGFGFDIFDTGAALEIVESDVAGAMGLLFLPYPVQVLPKLGGTNARKANPHEALVHRKQPTAPAQVFATGTAHFVQIVSALDLERSRIRNHDVPVDGREIQQAVEEKTVVRPLNRDFDLARGVLQADGIALMESRDKDFIAQLKNMVGMGAVRLSSRNFAVIDVSRKNAPGIFPITSQYRSSFPSSETSATISRPVTITSSVPCGVG